MITTRLHVYGDDDRTYETGVKAGLSEKALETFVYAAYELVLDVVIDEDTGEAVATHLNGVALTAPVKI